MTKTGSDAVATAYERIRNDIVTGVLAEHERLTERSLSERLGISRTPVRAAIARLVHEGFIEQGQGYSTRVARFPEDELEQIFQLRLQLEGFAARRAAQFADATQIAMLRTLATRMSELTPPAGQREHAELSSCNERFHRTIAEAARSPRLLAMLSVAVDVGVVARTYTLYSEVDLQRSSRHHHEITDAVEAGSPEWAESVMRSHLLAAQATVRGV
ncbi:MAG: GntR family transcriptional regulator [Granulosicoccus sp.]